MIPTKPVPQYLHVAWDNCGYRTHWYDCEVDFAVPLAVLREVRELHMYRSFTRYLCPISRIRNVRCSSIIEAAEASEMETEIGFLNQ